MDLLIFTWTVTQPVRAQGPGRSLRGLRHRPSGLKALTDAKHMRPRSNQPVNLHAAFADCKTAITDCTMQLEQEVETKNSPLHLMADAC